MQLKKWLLCISLLLLVSACAPEVRKVEYRPTKNYVIASWYGAKFHGRPTSSGERYDMYGFTAAHKTLVFGTKLKVTNPDNQKSVVVTVNDRGPFIHGRDLDLSYGAAKAIGHIEKGVGRVKIEFLGRDVRYVKRVAYQPSLAVPSPVPVTIQVGSFSDKERAKRLQQGLALQYKNVVIQHVKIAGEEFFRVRIGRFKNKDSAKKIADQLADEGYDVLVTSKDL